MFNFFIEHSSSSGSLFWSSIIGCLSGVVIAMITSYLAYCGNRKVSEANRVFNAKKDAYDAVLSFVNEAQARKGVIDLARVEIIGAKLQLWSTAEILDAYIQLEKKWIESSEKAGRSEVDSQQHSDRETVNSGGKLGTGMVTEADIDAFTDLLRKDLGIKELQS